MFRFQKHPLVFNAPYRYAVRSLALSDIHLGTAECQHSMLTGLLRVVQPENLYLVGDVVDSERLKRRHYWPHGHEEVLKEVRHHSRRGARVVYVPGNHDEGLRVHLEQQGLDMDDTSREMRDPTSGIILKQRDIHVGADGRRHLVTHGDRGDAVIHSHFGRQLAAVGDVATEALAWGNRHYNHARHALGLIYQPLDGYFKKIFNNGKYMRLFRQHVAEEAAAHQVEGVICGHVHVPEIRTTPAALEYKNCGDMVGSVSALVESHDGRFRQLNWAPIFNAYQFAVRRGERHPASVFECLATNYGAVPQPVAANEPLKLGGEAGPTGNVASAFGHLLQAASLDCGDKAYHRRIRANSQMSVSPRR